MNEYIAHSEKENSKTQSLEEHLQNVSCLSGLFASKFKSKEWGELLGLWHDIGKLNPCFQEFIRQESGLSESKRSISKADRAHALAGAIALISHVQMLLPLAYCIEGHHAGLPNWYNDLDIKLKVDSIYCKIKDHIFLPDPKQPTSFPHLNEKVFHHWIRMLFSCLVDADRLDTELFVNPDQSAQRSQYDSLSVLEQRLDTYLSRFGTVPDTPLNRNRKKILSTCREKASLTAGFYSLTVPTGGGKTLSSIAWALRHAIANGKDRIIVAIPYTSIITQTASIFREIFGHHNVLEHHCNLSEEISEEYDENLSMRLASENWDVPIVITTNVQLFESLHSSKPSVCRKLHNICNSVLILDEAQMLPVEFLKPILESLNVLEGLFRTSVLFMTATQPAFSGKIGSGREAFKAIEKEIIELIPDSETLYADFKRTQLSLFQEGIPINSEMLAAELCIHEQVLCVVNTRREAQELCKLMPEGTVHLSRNMYSKHLMDQIDEIRNRLRENKPIRVISTQLIEAGVDIDFPVVYRAFAGLDSIVQAAGRCNREGKQAMGNVFMFCIEGERLRGSMSGSVNATKCILDQYSIDDATSPSVLKKYFEILYSKSSTMDKPQTKDHLIKDACSCKFLFETYSKNFQLIDDRGAVSLLIPKEEGTVICQKIRSGSILTLNDFRTMQRFSVSVPKYVADELYKHNAVERYGELSILADAFYNKQYGVVSSDRWSDELLMI